MNTIPADPDTCWQIRSDTIPYLAACWPYYRPQHRTRTGRSSSHTPFLHPESNERSEVTKVPNELNGDTANVCFGSKADIRSGLSRGVFRSLMVCFRKAVQLQASNANWRFFSFARAPARETSNHRWEKTGLAISQRTSTAIPFEGREDRPPPFTISHYFRELERSRAARPMFSVVPQRLPQSSPPFPRLLMPCAALALASAPFSR